MKTHYFDLRERLAELFPMPETWRRVAEESGADTKNIVFEGAALGVWTNILTSLRLQDNLQGLIAVLKKGESPEAVVDLAERYAAEVASGKGAVSDMPELRAVNIAASDLVPEKILQSLKFGEMLPLGLLRQALAGKQLKVEDIDSELKGTHTNAAKAVLQDYLSQANRELDALVTQSDKAKSALGELKGEIQTIAAASAPKMPEARTSFTSEADRQFASARYSEEMAKYKTAMAAYEEDRNSLPSLRAEAARTEEHVAQQELAISSRKAAIRSEVRGLEDAIATARDRDLLRKLDETLEEALAALQGNTAPFQGFCTLLGASCLLELFENIFSQASAATEAGRKFSDSADIFGPSLEQRLPAIAKASLAGPLFVQQALAKTRNEIKALAERLEKLPAAVMDQRCRDAQNLLRKPLPNVPKYDREERADKLEAFRQQSIASQKAVKANIDELGKLIEGESEELKTQVYRATADAESVIGQIRGFGETYKEVVDRFSLIWSLITRGAAGANLPVFAHRLCVALPQEFSRRAEADAMAVIDDGETSKLGLKDAQEFLKLHLLSRYRQASEQIHIRLSESKELLTELEAIEGGIDMRYAEVAGSYRKRLKTIAILSVIPLIGLAASIWGIPIIGRLVPLISGPRLEYIQLGKFAFKALAWATLVSAAITAIIAVLVFYSPGYLDPSYQPAGIMVVVAGAVSIVVTLRNLLKIRAAGHSGKT
jgi:hypothetical protein